jgi:hypothetical protein
MIVFGFGFICHILVRLEEVYYFTEDLLDPELTLN